MNRLFCNILCCKRKVQWGEFRHSKTFCVSQEQDSVDQLKLGCSAVPGKLLGWGVSLLALMLPGCEAAAP